MIQPYRVERTEGATSITFRIVGVGDGDICHGIRDMTKAYLIADLLNRYEAEGVVIQAARRAAAHG